MKVEIPVTEEELAAERAKVRTPAAVLAREQHGAPLASGKASPGDEAMVAACLGALGRLTDAGSIASVLGAVVKHAQASGVEARVVRGILADHTLTEAQSKPVPVEVKASSHGTH